MCRILTYVATFFSILKQHFNDKITQPAILDIQGHLITHDVFLGTQRVNEDSGLFLAWDYLCEQHNLFW